MKDWAQKGHKKSSLINFSPKLIGMHFIKNRLNLHSNQKYLIKKI
jgi:hypothetical protein